MAAFSSGELSPEIYDTFEYPRQPFGLKECLNMIITTLGSVKNRPGTRFIEEVRDSAELSRYIPYQFNKEQAYVLEFSDFRLRIIKDGELILRDLVDAAYKWTLSGSGTSEYYIELTAGGDPSLLEPSFVLEDSAKMTDGTLGSLAAGEWDYGDNDALGYSTIYVRLSDSTDPDSKAQGYVQVPVLVSTPYPLADIQTLDHTFDADTSYLFHGDYNLYTLIRTSDTSWPVTEIPDMDGPYKPREDGDNLISIEVKKFSGTTWTFTADSAIFGDTEIGDPIRAGFQIPGDPDAIYWSWFVVNTLVSDTVIRAALQGSGVGDERVVYQQILNPFFDSGIDFWEDISTGTAGEVSYSFTNQSAVLTDFADGQPTRMEQSIITFPNQQHRIVVNVNAMSGTSPTVITRVGTTSGAFDILDATPIVAPGTYIFDFKPTQSLVYVNFNTFGSTNGDVIEITTVEVFPLGDTPAGGTSYTTTEWRLASWNSTHGWPHFGKISEQRLYAARTDTEPQTVWASVLDNFESHGFNSPSIDTDAFSFKPYSPEKNGIRFLVLHNGLKIGTSDAIWSMFATDGGAVKPSNVNIKIDSATGVLDLPPITEGNSIILTPSGSTAVAELISSFEASGYVPFDLSNDSNHLFKGRRIIRWAFARNPDSVIWCVLDNGELLGITYLRRPGQPGLWAWHKHATPLGEGFKDIAVIPNSSDDNVDDVYFIINRAEAGSTPNYYMEQLNKRITPQEAAFGLSASGTPFDYKFLDSAVTEDDPKNISGATQADPVVLTVTGHGYSDGDFVRIQNIKGMTELNNNVYKVANKAANTFELNDEDDNDIDGTGFTAYIADGESRIMKTTISELGHLEGEIIYALADGSVEDGIDGAGLTVSGGSVTLSQAASFRHAGIPYVSRIETLNVETPETQGMLKNVLKANIYFNDSREAEIATSDDPENWKPIEFRNESEGEEPIPLFTGTKEKTINSFTREQISVKIRQTKPLPISIRRIINDVEVGG
jgi:hypothetical protein